MTDPFFPSMKTMLAVAVGWLSLTFIALAGPDPAARFQVANVADVLLDYGKLTGKKILCDNTVQGQVEFAVSADEGVDRRVELIEKALFLNGFKLVEIGDDVVAVIGLGKPVRNVGVPLYTKPEEIPGGQRVFSYLFKLEHGNAQEVAGFLTQYIPPDAATAFTPDKGSNTLLATGQTSVIRSVIRLVAALDVPADAVARTGEPTPRPPVKSADGNGK